MHSCEKRKFALRNAHFQEEDEDKESLSPLQECLTLYTSPYVPEPILWISSYSSSGLRREIPELNKLVVAWWAILSTFFASGALPAAIRPQPDDTWRSSLSDSDDFLPCRRPFTSRSKTMSSASPSPEEFLCHLHLLFTHKTWWPKFGSLEHHNPEVLATEAPPRSNYF